MADGGVTDASMHAPVSSIRTLVSGAWSMPALRTSMRTPELDSRKEHV
jgi:hypothetical protein